VLRTKAYGGLSRPRQSNMPNCASTIARTEEIVAAIATL
jgi:hypothetical protein